VGLVGAETERSRLRLWLLLLDWGRPLLVLLLLLTLVLLLLLLLLLVVVLGLVGRRRREWVVVWSCHDDGQGTATSFITLLDCARRR
jgi:hypothetical protein